MVLVVMANMLCKNIVSSNCTELVVWCSGNAFDLINEVTVRRARLVLGWVTVCGQVNYLGM